MNETNGVTSATFRVFAWRPPTMWVPLVTSDKKLQLHQGVKTTW
jgi:hypothetical protein